MQGIIETALMEVVRQKLRDPDWASLIAQFLSRLHSGTVDSVDFYFQHGHWAERYTLEDAYACLVLEAGVLAGQIVRCDVCVHCEPEPDSMMELNSTNLRAAFSGDDWEWNGQQKSPNFSVELWGGTQGEDGWLSWGEPVMFEQFRDGQPHGFIPVPEKTIPIEVGSQKAAKTLAQIRQYGGLARWPYHSNTIRIFYDVGLPRMSMNWQRRT